MTVRLRSAAVVAAALAVAALLSTVAVGRPGAAGAGTTGGTYDAFVASGTAGLSTVPLTNVGGGPTATSRPGLQSSYGPVALNSTSTVVAVGQNLVNTDFPAAAVILFNARTGGQVGGMALGRSTVLAVVADPNDPGVGYALLSDQTIDRISLTGTGSLLGVVSGAGAMSAAASVSSVSSMAITPDGAHLVVGYSEGADYGLIEVSTLTGALGFWSTRPVKCGSYSATVAVAVAPQGGLAYLAADCLGGGGPAVAEAVPLPFPPALRSDWRAVLNITTARSITVGADGGSVYVVGSQTSPSGAPGTGMIQQVSGGPSGGALSGTRVLDALFLDPNNGGGPTAVAESPDRGTVLVAGQDGNGRDLVVPVSSAGLVPGAPADLGANGYPAGPQNLAVTPDQAPAASLADATATAAQAVTLDASASNIAYGSIVRYAWSFGDGTAGALTGVPTVSHTYSSPGSYVATVTETDTAGVSLPPAPFVGSPVNGPGTTPYLRASASAQAKATITVLPPGVHPAATTTTRGPAPPGPPHPGALHPVVRLNPGLGSPGTIVMVTGTGFKPHTQVTVRWSVSTGSFSVMTDGHGDFSASPGSPDQLFVLTPDVLGPRLAVATGPGSPAAQAPFLVIPGSAQPGGDSHSYLFRSEGP